MLQVLTGGARSGKSSLAVGAAAESGRDVVFIATAERGRDVEFTARIERHRADRPTGWLVIEEPVELGRALGAAPADAFVVIDCLTLWVANLIEDGRSADAVVAAACAVAASAAGRAAPTVAVTNEVGLGIVPLNPGARAYRDVLGSVNTVWVSAAETAALVVAGRTVALEPWAGVAE